MKTKVLLFVFFTLIVKYGFTQTYTMSSTLVSTCGGNFYDSGGSGGNYSNSQNDTMTFSSNNGSRIQFNFSSFVTESGYDILYVYDGSSINAPLLGQYTGSNSPGIVTSTSTSLTFRFISDGSTAYSGWSASISCTTPALTSYPMTNGQSVTTCSGVFYDDAGGESNYSHNQNSVMTFCPSTANDYLSISFPYQFILSSDDTLYAYSGSTTSSPLIGIYTSNNKIETISSPTAGTCITFKFISNSINASAGWQGVLSCSSVPVTPNFNMGTGTRYICGGNFYDVGGSTSNYANSENKIQTFSSNNGNRIQFNFSSFVTESGYDILYVYDGSSINAPLLGQYTGSNSPGIVTSTGTSLTFRFVSDGGTAYSGWSASISCTTPALTSYPMNNGQSVTTCSGIFYDNAGGESNYSHNQNSVMTFCPSTANDYLSISFPYQFILSSDDTLYAYSGSTTSSPLIGIYTSNNKTETISSPTAGTCITFKFISNSTNASAGWQGVLSCSSVPVTQNFNMGTGTRYICGGGFYDIGGSTSNYASSENKVMTFYSTSGCGIKFDFSAFATEASYDKLFVYDGPTTGSTLLGTYSGTQSAFSVQSSGTALTFKFTSDGSTVYSGWTAAISCPNVPASVITPSGPLSICQNDSVTLTVSSATSYLWNTGATTQAVKVSTDGTYSVTVTNSSGCTGTSLPTEVVVKSLPSTPVITANGPTTFCQGGNVTLTSSASMGNTWSNSLTSQAITISSAGSYFVTVDSNGCASSSVPVSITVNPIPAIPVITANGPVNFCQGGSVVLTSSAGAGNTWSNADVTQSTTISSAGTYTVTVSNGNCNSTSLPLTVTVDNSVPSTPLAISGDDSVCAASTNLYTVAPINNATSYVWTLPSGWSGSSSSTLINAVADNTGGMISVTANNSCGASVPQTLNVVIGDSVPLMPGPITGNTTVCSGSSNIYGIATVNGALNYSWSFPSGWSGSSSTTSITAVSSTSGSGTVSVTASNSCGTSSAQTISVSVQVIDTSVQQSGGVLTSNSIGGGYQWINCNNNTAIPLETNNSFMPLAPGSYAVVVTQNGCSDTSACYNVMSTEIKEAETLGITIGPNPSDGKFVIQVTHAFNNAVFEIYNILGEKVYESRFNAISSHEVTIQNASSGVYLLKIYQAGKIISKRIIIQ